MRKIVSRVISLFRDTYFVREEILRVLDGYSREKVDSLKGENFKGGSLSFEGIDGATKFSGSLGEKESTGDLGAIFNSK